MTAIIGNCYIDFPYHIEIIVKSQQRKNKPNQRITIPSIHYTVRNTIYIIILLFIIGQPIIPTVKTEFHETNLRNDIYRNDFIVFF